MKTRSKTKKPQDDGYALPMVLAISLIVGAGMMAATTQAWVNYQGVGRQSQARFAKEVAEAGLAELVETLNRNHAHLLVLNEYLEDSENSIPPKISQWGDPPLSSSICSNSTLGTPARTGTVGTNGYYQLESYTFNGSAFFGGKADIRMRGEYRQNGTTKAAAIVEKTIEIKPKPCDDAFGQPASTSGFPGLLAKDITLGGNDVLGRMSGNVLCTGCEDESDLGSNTTSIIGGKKFFGPIDLPPVPTPPESLKSLLINPYSCTQQCGDIEIVSGSTDPDKSLNGQCKQDDKGITHCVVERLIMRNGELKINTTNGPVRIYFTGSGDIFKSTGNGGIRHEPPSAGSTNLGLFGIPTDGKDQNLTLRGAAHADGEKQNNLWAYFPKGNLGIAGGAKENAECEEVDGVLGECTGGDIYGAVWAKTWGQVSGASSGTKVQIVVPPNMGNDIYKNFGEDYAIGMKDYVALGVTKWSSFTIDNKRSASP